MDESTIFGIDPGTLITGYGAIRLKKNGYEVIDYGCIKTKSTLPLTRRYRVIFESISELLDKYPPHALSIETQYIHKNVASGLKLGMARGVCCLAATLRNIEVFEYAPAVAKRAIVGNGKASKIQVQTMTKHLLSLSTLPQPEDAADALALAICHAHMLKNNLNRRYQI